jgi:hypothetical protein
LLLSDAASQLGCADPAAPLEPQPPGLGDLRAESARDDALAPAPPQKGDTGEPTSSTYPAPHPSMPQIPKNGGSVLDHPRIVTVTFPDDPWQSRLEAFGEQVGRLRWWTTVHDGYGVGPAESGGHVAIQEAPPPSISDAEVTAWLAKAIADGALPAPTDQSIYLLYYPRATTVTLNDGSGDLASCQVFLGYHATIDVAYEGDTIPIAYAVVNRCEDDFDQLTVTASHELTEAATDPHPTDAASAGYVFLEDNAWTVLGGENADMCAGVSSTKEEGFTLTRVWNNNTAAAGDQPCVPAPEVEGVPYFNAGIVDDLLGARPGRSATTEVDCYSFGPLPAAIELTVRKHEDAPFGVKLEQKSCTNGDKLKMTISVHARAERGTVHPYSLVSTVDGKTSHLWRGMVHVD